MLPHTKPESDTRSDTHDTYEIIASFMATNRTPLALVFASFVVGVIVATLYSGQAFSAAVLAALIALLGVLYARTIEVSQATAQRRHEDEKARRENRLRVYESLAHAYFILRESMRRLALTQPGTPESGRAEQAVHKAGVEWNRQRVIVLLHNDPPVTGFLDQLDLEINRLYWLEARPRANAYTQESFREARQGATRKLEEFIKEVRRQQGLDPNAAVNLTRDFDRLLH